MKNQWDERYGANEYAYGESPNQYLKEKLAAIAPVNILFPAEGEGRNAVYAATLGFEVSAFDLSGEGKKKALKLAEKHGVHIRYDVGELASLDYLPEEFDAIALIYAHFPADKKSDYHKKLIDYLRKGGLLIFEAFCKNHLAYRALNEKVGGPNDLGMLFSMDEIASDFANFDIIELKEEVIELQEGLYHNGTGAVIRFLGRKR